MTVKPFFQRMARRVGGANPAGNAGGAGARTAWSRRPTGPTSWQSDPTVRQDCSTSRLCDQPVRQNGFAVRSGHSAAWWGHFASRLAGPTVRQNGSTARQSHSTSLPAGQKGPKMSKNTPFCPPTPAGGQKTTVCLPPPASRPPVAAGRWQPTVSLPASP